MSLGNHFRIFVCVVFMGVLVGYVFNAKKDITDNVYIDSVKEGYLVDFTDVKVRDAFNYAFTEPYWRYYEAKTGQHVVELSGDIVFLEEKGHAILQFVVNEEANEFKLFAMKFNDEVLDSQQKGTLIGMVYETWEMKQLAYQ
ncbi:hypothetical protein GY31_17975 [Lysinibacillus sphaericus]|uniref:Uncharacterized protein n=1 Tax=Lysinibacillus sphaericus TaxID=1421 RepID=A0A2S5CYY6_LYSSH|nr:hypothetical protein [Lysinibacillus sphaericus]OEC00711.1 hypothetical protein GY31_17975 [Lysinibacillus sphaericus]POZ56030.1 hypothetical protein LYSIN_00813 [Lysinibacillus sphaericus]